MRKSISSLLALGSALLLAVTLPSAATAATAVESSDQPLFEAFQTEMPSFMSDTDMALLAEGAVEIANPSQGQARGPWYSTLCTLDTGYVYKRASGAGTPYGTVGGKPKTTCTGPVARIEQSSAVYKATAGGWAKMTGDVWSYNTDQSSLQQTNVEYACTSLSTNTFKLVTLGAVWYYGQSPVSGGAYEQASLACS
mgnify:CR=1 FL=1